VVIRGDTVGIVELVQLHLTQVIGKLDVWRIDGKEVSVTPCPVDKRALAYPS
jgi:hypothetical protein